MIRFRIVLLLASALTMAGCDMAPRYTRAVSDFVPPQWPAGAAYAPATAGQAGMPWRTLVTDEKLRTVIDRALAHNQDLAVAVANVASARAQWRVERSYQLPTVAANGSAALQRRVGGPATTNNASTTLFSGNVGISAFELDLFGRVKNLSRAAFEQYLASQSGARSTRLTVVSDTATAYATLASDKMLLAVAQDQVVSAERSSKLTRDLHRVGLVDGSDMADADTLVAQARSDVESYTTQVAQDRNALELLVGAPVEDALLPASLDALDSGIANVPAGLSSDVLLARPDVVEAEHQLKATYADIGAARAAFFPQISLTTALGFATDALRTLFDGASTAWTATPTATLPLIGGTNGANLAYSKAQRDYYLATYRKTAQSAYRDVADGLARRGTIDRQRAAQRDLVAAAAKSYAISDARYRAGSDSFLTALITQRTLYSARQTAITIQLADLSNRIALYSAIGSDDTL